LKHALSLSAFQELESISAEIEGFLRKMFWRVAGLSTTSPVSFAPDLLLKFHLQRWRKIGLFHVARRAFLLVGVIIFGSEGFL
jgi:hypothetical protein